MAREDGRAARSSHAVAYHLPLANPLQKHSQFQYTGGGRWRLMWLLVEPLILRFASCNRENIADYVATSDMCAYEDERNITIFRDRNEELSHLIELYERSPPIGLDFDSDLDLNSHLKTNREILRAKVESFSTDMINYMLEDLDLDLIFANKLYEFDSQLFLTIFNKAISASYSNIGFNESLRIVGEVKYYAQAIEGYTTIYDQIKEDLSGNYEQSFKLREKLQKMLLMKDFEKLTQKEKTHINDMLEVLEPYAILPKPEKSERGVNWAEHYFLLGLIETKFENEKNKFFSLFRTET